MKKHFLLLFFAACTFCAQAQESSRTIAGSSMSCTSTAIGGCFNYLVGTYCTEFIYHIEICCTPPALGTTLPTCFTRGWTTPNPNYRLHSGAAQQPSETITLADLVKRIAESQGVAADEIKTFSVTDGEPFEGKDGNWYIVEKNTYKIDRSVPGWALAGLNIIPYQKQ
ncbi:MAG: hypothetical protein EOO15_24045 [Chitinophagaceae bacterium]|nr:MAG: hypothetical protein EOO15_24045 [Chitinophagaceae bacterium]